MAESSDRVRNTLVVRKPCYGLPTGCPQCLSAYIYLKLAQVPFDVDFHLNYPDSDKIPYFETGDYVAYNNEKGGLIECLKKDVVDIDAGLPSVADWTPMKVMLTTWLADALAYELWVGGDSSSAYNIYYSGLPWPIGKLLFWKQAHLLKLQYGVTKDNAEAKEEEIYSRANSAYDALSTFLGDQNYFVENRPSSLDAIFLAHALVILQALPETSVLRTKLLEHANLVRYLQKCKTEVIDADPFPSSDSPLHNDASSSASRGYSNWSIRDFLRSMVLLETQSSERLGNLEHCLELQDIMFETVDALMDQNTQDFIELKHDLASYSIHTKQRLVDFSKFDGSD